MEEKQGLLTEERRKGEEGHPWLSLLALLLSIPLLLMLISVLHPFSTFFTHHPQPSPKPCTGGCSVQLVESIPEGLVFNSTVKHLSTHAAWSQLLGLAKEEVLLAGMYWTLKGSTLYPDPSDWAGEDIFQKLHKAVGSGKISLKIAQNAAAPGKSPETEELAKAGAEVRGVNFTALMGAGILHTKVPEHTTLFQVCNNIGFSCGLLMDVTFMSAQQISTGDH